MKHLTKLAFASLGAAALLVQGAFAQVLFSTTSDFTGWSAASGTTVGPTTDWSYDALTVNGMGNNPGNSGGSINVGGTSSSGSISIQGLPSGGFWGAVAWSPGEAYNPSFMHTIDPGSLAAYSAESGYGSGTTVAFAGVMTLVYTLPDNEGGTYFEPGIGLAYDGNGYWGQFFPDGGNPAGAGSITSLGSVNGYDTYQATIPYTINAGSLGGLTMAIWANEDYGSVLPFYVDSISVSAVPEPSTAALVGLGTLSLTLLRRRRP